MTTTNDDIRKKRICLAIMILSMSVALCSCGQNNTDKSELVQSVVDETIHEDPLIVLIRDDEMTERIENYNDIENDTADISSGKDDYVVSRVKNEESETPTTIEHNTDIRPSGGMDSVAQTDDEVDTGHIVGYSYGGGSNFDTYDNASQQITEDTYVLNTSTMKIHYPSCDFVKKIAPQNYATSSDSLDVLHAQGYTLCGKCFQK